MKKESDFKKLRKQIEEIDEKIFSLFIERINIVKKIAKIKKENGISMENLQREEKLIKRIKQKFSNLDNQFIEAIFKIIFHYSKINQLSFSKNHE